MRVKQSPECVHCTHFCPPDHNDEQPTLGECRRNPPVCIINPKHTGIRSIWPKVHQHGWCGEFQEEEL